MRIRVELPVSEKRETVLATKTKNYIRDNRIGTVLEAHQLRYGVLKNFIVTNLASAKSGRSPEEIYCELRLAFDYPITILEK